MFQNLCHETPIPYVTAEAVTDTDGLFYPVFCCRPVENLNLLVERIEVFNRAATDNGVEQTIRICYRFGGYIGDRRFMAKVLKHPSRKKGADNGKDYL